MAKKLGILLTIILLSSKIFSQKDTNKICFDEPTAKKIAADLVKGDSAKAELERTQKLVKQFKEKLIEKDSIISDYIKKDTNYLTQIQKYAEIKEKQSILVKGLEKDKEKLIAENNTLKVGIKWLGGGFVGTLISLLTLSLVK